MFGECKGYGRGGRQGKGKGRNNMLEKECICPECKMIKPQRRGLPCCKVKCPRCGSVMMGRLNSDMK